MPNFRKLISTAESKQRQKRTKSTHPQQRINLNINNYKISFSHLGKYVVQQDNQFKRGDAAHYSEKIVQELKEPTLRTLGKELHDMDA